MFKYILIFILLLAVVGCQTSTPNITLTTYAPVEMMVGQVAPSDGYILTEFDFSCLESGDKVIDYKQIKFGQVIDTKCIFVDKRSVNIDFGGYITIPKKKTN